MARLIVPKVPAFVQELCRRAGVRLRKFKSAGEFERAVSNFLKAHDILYLSTSKNDAPRCTPVGYFHSGMTVYVLSEGGGKFANLKANPSVSYAIASRIEGRMGILEVRGLQCWGRASVISMKKEPEEFSRLMDELGLTERLKKRGEKLPPFNYRFIKIVPHKMRVLNLREGIYNVTWTR
jgi:uncharacterized protein YhbP (UPF0306 family)